jgi:hypothetical protein
VEKLCGKIAPKNCAEKFARKKKKNGTGAAAENGKRKLPSLEMKKSITLLLPTNFFYSSRSQLRTVALRFCAALRHCTYTR